ncbi:hypothetical protein H4R18_000760 [Coemansia javaensis]|uniref:Vezatin n=1 Tax=Coemansia javaensis TaxID=2761396 RepID=A0A9W8HK77_9FUNG|nr:hypothetical protein H4R18_000760 [Coemansia javaensis]
MAELVAFEDSPLGQYLHEVGAGEALVADCSPAEQHEDAEGGRATWTAWLLQCSGRAVRVAFGTSRAALDAAAAPEVWAAVARILADSGHMADRYTPARTHGSSGSTSSASAILPARATAELHRALAAAAVPLAAGGALRMSRATTPGAWMLMAGGAVAVAGVLQRIRAAAAVRDADAVVGEFRAMARSCRALDVSAHRALRFVHEVDLVARGLRLPAQGAAPTAVGWRPGRGTLLLTQRVRAAVGSALAQSAGALAGAAEDLAHVASGHRAPAQQGGAVAELLDAAADAQRSLAEGAASLEALRGAFDAHFALRRQWLERMLDLLECSAYPCVGRTHALARDAARRVRAAADAGVAEIAAARAAQHTAARWESLAATGANHHHHHQGGGGGDQPLRRALGRLSDTLNAIQAKVVVCRACIGDPDGADSLCGSTSSGPGSVEMTAQVFASLKADIDMLNAHYQESVTLLLCADGDRGGPEAAGSSDGGLEAGSVGAELHADDDGVPDGVRVFECAPFGAGSLDAPEQAFEAEAEPIGRRGARSAAAAPDRSERIRIQRDRRAEEAAARERRSDIGSMMSELRSAIGSRATGGGQECARTK